MLIGLIVYWVLQLLFAIKELLDLPGLAFILAFDPEVINESLKVNNYNISQRKRFLR